MTTATKPRPRLRLTLTDLHDSAPQEDLWERERRAAYREQSYRHRYWLPAGGGFRKRRHLSRA